MKKYAVTTAVPPFETVPSRFSSITWKAKVYNFVKASGDEGANRREVAEGVGLNIGRVSSCLAELKREGLVKRLGDAIDPATLSPEDAVLFAMTALEGALVAKAARMGTIPPDVEREFARYQKVKSVALHAASGGQTGASENEIRQALRLSLISLVKLVV